MCDFFRDRYLDERARAGRAGLVALWGRTLTDVLLNGARERIADLTSQQVARRSMSMPIAADPFPHRTVSTPRALLGDARFALRVFRKNPLFVATAAAVIALGTGAVSTIFSVANAFVLRPIPGTRDASRLVEVGRTRAGGGGSLSASYPYYESIREGTRTLDGLAAWGMLSVTLSTGGQGIQGLGNAVSGNYFSVLGVRPALGTLFSGADDRALANEPIAVVSHAFWQRQLAGDSGAVGRTIHVNGRPLTVVGVAAPRFTGVFPALRTDVWVPLGLRMQLRQERSTFDDAGSSWMQLVGRLAPYSDVDRAREELTALTGRYLASAGDAEPRGMAEYDGADVDAVAGVPSDVAGAVAGFIGVLLAIAALVLVIASLNVASMLLARAVTRRREIAMRMALGASRLRLVRQLVVESMMLFAAGGIAGTLLAVWGTRLLQQVELPIDLPLELDVSPDATVLAVTLGVSLVTGLVFGLAPAFQGSRLDVQGTLRSDSAGAGRRRSRLRDGLVVGQIALSLLLLTCAGLFVRALGKGRNADPGFSVDGVVTTAIDLESAGYDDQKARIFYRALAERIAVAPGVQSVAYARVLPLSMNTSGRGVVIPGQVPPGGKPGDEIPVAVDEVDEGYFSALRIPLLRGRGITASDDERAARVAVVNETFVRRFYPNGDALNRAIRMDDSVVTIVGVVRDSKFSKLDEAPEPFMYLPAAQFFRAASNILVRTTGAPEAVTIALLREMSQLDPMLPPPRVTTLRQSTAVMLLPQRVAAGVTGALGITGLLLAAVGLYGILAFSTAQRTREIGVRLALGASRHGIVRMVLGEGVRLAGVGVAAGLLLAFMATRALQPFLFGLDPLDPLTFSAIAMVLTVVAVAATWLPARRAAAIDPMQSMREE